MSNISSLREPKSYPSPRASEFRKPTYTQSEIAIASLLSLRGVHFRTQVPYDSGRTRITTKEDGEQPIYYYVDILIGNFLAVEVEGAGSHSANNDERDECLRNHGLHVMHVRSDEIYDNAVEKICAAWYLYNALEKKLLTGDELLRLIQPPNVTEHGMLELLATHFPEYFKLVAKLGE